MSAPRAVAWAVADPYAAALRTGRGPLFLRRADGWLLPLEVERWCARADPADRTVLDRCEGAVLDVGCGPGRLVAELAARGRTVLGIDVSEAAVDRTVRRLGSGPPGPDPATGGGRALRRSVFEPLPGEGHWGTVLLMDGNIGIGGDPGALLDRVARLLSPGGLLIAETAAVDVDELSEVEVVDHTGARAGGGAFPWARLGTPALLRYAGRAGWRSVGQWAAGGRRFAALRSLPGARPPERATRTASSSAEPPKRTAVISSQRAGKPSAGRPVADR
ncbi:class I SAM-dependent methyltransferase [Streptomyces sp. NPDC013455]|uniref:class I SAM-dependent methyltransferase n=1 Tax=Streptomyces sp. NPDC013455 TaxID=3155605 RepID=UPI0033CC7A44